jgi:hypothetical protein
VKSAIEASLTDKMSPFIPREIASIGDLDRAIDAEKDPGYVVLFRSLKSEKQAAAEQVAALLRIVGGRRVDGAFRRGQFVEAEVHAASTSRRLQLEALRRTETALREAYGVIEGELAADLEKRVVKKVSDRAVKRWHVVTAHLARVTGDQQIMRGLPRPLEEYFATPEDRVCMRCLFDRPGTESPLVRSDPHPETYVCSACHGEVLDGFPPDMKPLVERCSRERRNTAVIQRALSRPEILRASETVLAVLSGLPPAEPRPPRVGFDEARRERRWAVDPRDATVEIPRRASASEQRYVDALFDFESFSRWW